ncbi:hypothetical protein CYLTODRAFT_91102 [Cylindrobasidium torrendii FP15055 ss-10]|uniref:Uncharacterized protein n=1 Tax=Cylindrobasidium torrendii FP15055 ss-10 TaxID=1314674 RepID=A0A0D7BUC6_9AGAR|nr:hypothetical protein CYLTODRAFT_91102 [Cylindrobasidium torrendii FP15055 ss-10]
MYLSYCLVSHEFAWEFYHAFFANVHLLTVAHVEFCFTRLHTGRSLIFARHPAISGSLPRSLCQSLTWHVEEDVEEPRGGSHVAVKQYQALMPKISTYFPSVTQLAINYHNAASNDECILQLVLPEQVTHLSLRYMFNELADPGAQRLYTSQPFDRKNARTSFPGVEHLEIIGGNMALLTGMMRKCPNVKIVRHGCVGIRR